MKTLYRYTAKKVFLAFIAFFAILTLCILSGYSIRITELVVENGFSPMSVMRMLAFLLPTFLAISIPISLLMSTAYTFMDFKTTKEAYAMASHGVSPKKLFIPVALLGTLGAVGCLWANGWLVPLSQLRLEHYAFSLASQRVTVGIKEASFVKLFPDFSVYITKLSPQRDSFEGVYIHSVQQGEPFYIFAKTGTLISNPSKATLILRLFDGSIQYAHGKDIKQEGSLFRIQDIDLRAFASLKNPIISKSDKRTDTLSELMNPKRLELENKDEWLARSIEANKRLAMSISPLVMALLGAYIGLLQPLRPRWISLILASLIVLVTHLGLMLAQTLASNRACPPWVALESINILLFLFWLSGMLRSDRHFLRFEPLFGSWRLTLSRPWAKPTGVRA